MSGPIGQFRGWKKEMVFRYSKKKKRSKTMEERQGVETLVREIKRKTIKILFDSKVYENFYLSPQ